MKTPLVSVIMPAYNVECFVEEAMNSILKQTYSNFEFIIINDGSTDNTSDIIESIKDNRIIYLNNKDNRGNYACRNEGCKLAKGKYICVMDADDIAMPERIEKQLSLMESNTDILASGSDFEFINTNWGIHRKPKEFATLKVLLLFNNMFLHPSLIIRKEVLERVKFYNEEFYFSSDYDLMCRIAFLGKVINVPDILMKYRVHEKQISSEQTSKQGFYADQIRIKYLLNCGFKITTEQEFIFTKIMRKEFRKKEPKSVKKLFEHIKNQNTELGVFDQNILNIFFIQILQRFHP